MSNKEPRLNVCEVCNASYVVNRLARCCELKHQGVVFVRDPRQEPKIESDKKEDEEND